MIVHRKLFSLIIKSLIFLGLLLLLVVLVNSLFTSSANHSTKTNKELPTVIIDISDMYNGQIRKIRWKNKEIGILRRQFPEKLTKVPIETSKEALHSTLNNKTRSVKNDYFVYLNIGDSNNCPLFYSGGEFKDVCSSNKFDESGRSISASSQSFKIKIPPHYFNVNQLVIGKWQL